MSQTKEFLSGLMKEKALIMQKLEPRKAPPKLIKRPTGMSCDVSYMVMITSNQILVVVTTISHSLNQSGLPKLYFVPRFHRHK